MSQPNHNESGGTDHSMQWDNEFNLLGDLFDPLAQVSSPNDGGANGTTDDGGLNQQPAAASPGDQQSSTTNQVPQQPATTPLVSQQPEATPPVPQQPAATPTRTPQQVGGAQGIQQGLAANPEHQQQVVGLQQPVEEMTSSQRRKWRELPVKLRELEELHQQIEMEAAQISNSSMQRLIGLESLVNNIWAEFRSLQSEIMEFIPMNLDLVFDNRVYQAKQVKLKSIMMIYDLKGQLEKGEESTKGSAGNSGNQLARLALPVFSGSFPAWKQFNDSFQSLVGSLNIPDVQKLARLKECLRGPAADLISTFNITEDNYAKAWAKLTQKYDNPRVIAASLFNRILSMPKINNPTSENLSSNAAKTQETLDFLLSMTGLPKEELIEQFMVYLLSSSLDDGTLKEWEIKMSDSKKFPSLQELVTFLEACARGIRARESFQETPPKQPGNNNKKKKKAGINHATQQGQNNDTPPTPKNLQNCCSHCSGQHFLAYCQRFGELSPVQRYEVAIRKRLCFNCLGSHRVKGCSQVGKKFCYKCKGNHHTLLHGSTPFMTGPTSPMDLNTPQVNNPPGPGGANQKASRASPTSTTPETINNQRTNEYEKRLTPPVNEDTNNQTIKNASREINEERIINDNSIDGAINNHQYHAEIINNQNILEQSTNQQSSINHSAAEQKFVLLATAKAQVLSPSGFSIEARLLIDQGSELSFITDQLVRQLKLQRRASTIELIGIGGTNSGRTRGQVTVTLQSTTQQKQAQLNAHILRRLTTRLPSFSCKSASIGSLAELQLADDDYLKPGSIDIIIGADNYGQIIEDEVIRSGNSQLVGQRTLFGWILSGPICCKGCSTATSLTAVKKSSNEQLIELLQRFWNQEELQNQSTSRELSPEDQQCEEHFLKTHTRDHTGRYVVRLPLRTSTNALGDSKYKASRQLQGVLRRLKSNETYAKLYKDFIKEYEALGHMRQVPDDAPDPSKAYHLPHHGVMREDAITTKLRVVFNGSSPSSTNVSLNDILYTGGKLQVDAMDVLTWFRQHRYVFGTDIEKMFRQINVHPDDWDLLRILWVNEETNKLITYQLTTVTYGTSCAPWQALRCLQQLAVDEGHRYPAAVEAITKGRYVDDIYGGSSNKDELKKIIIQLIGLCKAGGFPLQKWTSNCPDVLQQLGLSTGNSTVDFEEAVVKVLGLCWQPATDSFQYKSKQFNSTTFTKRTLLSEIAQIFDPLGFIAPVVVRGKMIIQDLWKIKLNWDDPLPTEQVHQWRNFREDLTKLNQLSIPRWLRNSPATVNVQIHGFADASTTAMGAVVYLRTESINETITTTLVCAKTRVAPIKRTTIPRLELNAAAMLTQLVVWTINTLEMKNPEIHLWSDSTVALAWINSHASRWKDYVHNRVVQIQEALPTATWRHVNGLENPADCASRGVTAQQLSVHQLWWTGPEWLRQEDDSWPSSTTEVPTEASAEEKPAPAHPVAVRLRVHAMAEVLERYSTLEKALQVTATINRAIDRFRRQPTPPSAALTTMELNEARLFWVKITQFQYFSSVLQTLNNGNQLPNRHPMANLTPTLDDQEILRLGGRLKNSLLDPEEIHPIILPRQSKLTSLVIEQAHRRTLHGGTQLTLAVTRQKYWIVGGRNTVRAFIQRCVTCTRHRGTVAQQLMGQLPSQRVSPARAFLHTGVDYAGPLPILKWRPTNAQPTTVHIVVFVCFTTSAVHLELVTRQTTDAFIGAYKRFTGRRGIPEKMYSDNASTLTGAATELDRLYQQGTEENQQVQAALATTGTQWSFIPPRAPHFGGKWEAAVKSVKYHLKRVLGTTLVTYEELNSILIQIEACLNSRPIAPMSDDPEDLQALTPGHFLIGEPLQLLPEPSVEPANPNKMQRWTLVTQKIQQFWKRWSKECLQRYQAISKWKHQQPNIQVGDMVLMVAEDHPPAKWPLARVINVSPGADGLTRVATVRVAQAEVPTHQDGTPRTDNVTVTFTNYNRPIAKLCRLPIDATQDDQPEEEAQRDDQRQSDEDQQE